MDLHKGPQAGLAQPETTIKPPRTDLDTQASLTWAYHTILMIY
ncbi:MAG TPA: hypothetical protein VGS28_00530 [Candidatus Saccharimonadales bacterium]|nr:hypothetical protein [Candidatus Saccharimonadales bacterium]